MLKQSVVLVILIHFTNFHHISTLCVKDTTRDQFHCIQQNWLDIVKDYCVCPATLATFSAPPTRQPPFRESRSLVCML